MEFDWRNTGDYVRYSAEQLHPLGKSRAIDSLGAASALLFPDREIYRGRLDAYC